MDPHSQLTQFNHRQKRSFLPRANSKSHMASTKSASSSEMPGKYGVQKPPVGKQRQIVSNSRVRQDEKYRKDLYLVYVNNALKQKDKSFDELCAQFSPQNSNARNPAAAMELRLWLEALTHSVSQLERRHRQLIHAIIAFPWTTMDSAYVKAHSAFAAALVTAKSEYLRSVLENIVQGFTYQSGLLALEAVTSEGSKKPLTRRMVYDRLHELLQRLIDVIPLIPSVLQPLLGRNFPHKRLSNLHQTTYTRNLLRVCQYAPELSDGIMTIVVDRTLQIDVEIQVELEEIDNLQDSGAADGDVFEMDPFDALVDDDANSGDELSGDESEDIFSDLSSDAGDDPASTPAPETTMQHVQEMVSKLDALLKLIFDHLREMYTNPPSRNSPAEDLSGSYFEATERLAEVAYQRRIQFLTVLSIFNRVILPTFKSRYTQFILFWCASLDMAFADLLQGALISRALIEHEQPPVLRAAAASYMGSLVSRAKFVDQAECRRVVALLCEFIANYLEEHDGANCDRADMAVFIATCQAAFIIFCFRWRELSDSAIGEDDAEDPLTIANKSWMKELNILPRAINSQLNPLRFCASHVVTQFAEVTRFTGFMYCYPVIEANRRKFQGDTSLKFRGVSNSDGSQEDLRFFFPFDPYGLPSSKAYIDGIFREWEEVKFKSEDDSEEGDDDDDDDYVEDEHYQPMHDSTEGLGESFGGMSISPVRPKGTRKE